MAFLTKITMDHQIADTKAGITEAFASDENAARLNVKVELVGDSQFAITGERAAVFEYAKAYFGADSLEDLAEYSDLNIQIVDASILKLSENGCVRLRDLGNGNAVVEMTNYRFKSINWVYCAFRSLPLADAERQFAKQAAGFQGTSPREVNSPYYS